MTAMEYEIRVPGLVPAAVLEEFEGVRVAVHPTVTILSGPVSDRAALPAARSGPGVDRRAPADRRSGVR